MSAIDIYITERNGDREVRIPWLPETIDYESGNVVTASYNLMDKGEIEIPTGSGLFRCSWESQFPGNLRTDKAMIRGTWQKPSIYDGIFRDWIKKGTPLRLMVTCYPINEDVYLEKYEASASGPFGDIEYKVSFMEDRKFTVTSTVIKQRQPRQHGRRRRQRPTRSKRETACGKFQKNFTEPEASGRPSTRQTRRSWIRWQRNTATNQTTAAGSFQGRPSRYRKREER